MDAQKEFPSKHQHGVMLAVCKYLFSHFGLFYFSICIFLWRCVSYFVPPEGKGIPPGVKPRVCKTCNGSGTVSVDFTTL